MSAKNPDDLFQFLHQFRLVLQPPGGVNDEHIAAGLSGLLKGIPGKAGGISAELGGNNRGIGPLTPDFQLLDGGGAKCITGGKHDTQTTCGQFCGQFANGGCLAGAIDPDHQDHMRLVAEIKLQRHGNRLQHSLDFVGHDGLDFLG